SPVITVPVPNVGSLVIVVVAMTPYVLDNPRSGDVAAEAVFDTTMLETESIKSDIEKYLRKLFLNIDNLLLASVLTCAYTSVCLKYYLYWLHTHSSL
ncbi:MAG: hypothetical protein ACE5RF_07115, partial [Nitrosarchaeum sp.]